MELLLTVILLAAGIVLIVKGGDLFVDAASWIAEVSGIPQFVIGATVVSLATTLPEIMVSVIAAAQGQADMAVGNAIGSVTANTGLIMGIALIAAPFAIKRSDYMIKSAIMLTSIAMLLMLCMFGMLDMLLGLLLFIPLGIFVAENIISAKKSMEIKAYSELTLSTGEGSAMRRNKKDVPQNTVKFILGAAAIIVGAKLLVDNGCALASLAGISEGIIAVTLVAVGTSLPELVTMVTAVAKKKGAMSIGNIIGANIIDITLILPLCALIGGGLPVESAAIALDLPFCLGIAVIALLPTLFTKKFQRWQGIAMAAAYFAYILLRILL